MIYQQPRYMAAGDQFLVMEIGTDMSLFSNCTVIELDRLLKEANVKGVLNTVSTWRSLMIQYDNAQIAFADLQKEMEKLWLSLGKLSRIPSRIIEIPIQYGGKRGPDFARTAEYNQVSEKEAIEIHSGELQWVGVVGFVPGHPFIKPLRQDKRLHGQIYSSPRTYTPEGTVGLGGVTTTVYTVPTSGGYQMIAYIPVPLYDPFQLQPDFQKTALLLLPGDRIRFRPIDDEEFDVITQQVRERKYKFNIQEGVFDIASYVKGGKA